MGAVKEAAWPVLEVLEQLEQVIRSAPKDQQSWLVESSLDQISDLEANLWLQANKAEAAR